MKMNSDDKFNVGIEFKIRALLCWSDLISLIGVDLSAWAAPATPAIFLPQDVHIFLSFLT
jgi:hypothetical protein